MYIFFLLSKDIKRLYSLFITKIKTVNDTFMRKHFFTITIRHFFFHYSKLKEKKRKSSRKFGAFVFLFYICPNNTEILSIKDMDNKPLKKKDFLKRNNEAPDFPTNIVKSRAELLVEMFVQKNEYNLQEFIDSQRIFKINIPIQILREWYPTPNWKKDVTKMVRQLNKVSRFESQPNGDFEYYSLISFSKFSEETGLQLNSDPEALRKFLIDSKSSYTMLDYELTNKFRCVYSHQLYWLICKHDNAYHDYKMYITPEEINRMFNLKYQSSDIKRFIFGPFKKELQKLYEDGETTRFVDIEDDCKVIGRRKQIIGFIIKINNSDRTNKIDLEALNAFKLVENIIQKYLPKYKRNIMQQLQVSKPEIIVALWVRLSDFDKSNKSEISNIPGYLCTILEVFQIKPHKKINITAAQIAESTLFDKEEKLTAEGIAAWMKCTEYWQSDAASEDVKSLFSVVRFDSYSRSSIDGHPKLVLSLPNENVYNSIELRYLDFLKKSIQFFFGENTELNYIIKR